MVNVPKRAVQFEVAGVNFHCILSIMRQAYGACATRQLPNPLIPMVIPKLSRARMQRGFTLIELMVVVVIIGVLAALIVPNVLERADDARVTAARTDIGNLVQQLKLYKLDNLRLPTASQGLQALVSKPTADPIPPNWKPYMDKLPNDPWGQPYVYLYPGVKGEFDVMSYGADGKPGGEGKDADIGSWQ